jgi:hypothetical protein
MPHLDPAFYDPACRQAFVRAVSSEHAAGTTGR